MSSRQDFAGAVPHAVRGSRWLLIGRAIAILQGAIWLLAMSSGPLSPGYVFALLAIAAVFVAERNPARSIGLLLAPVVFLMLVVGPFAAASSKSGVSLAWVAAMIVPSGIAAGLIWVGTRRPALARDLAGASRPAVSVRAGLGAAIVLGILAVPFVAVSFALSPATDVLANEGWASGPIDWQPVAPASGATLALLAVIASAMVGGTAGSVAWRWGRVRAGCVALSTAWATAIIGLPTFAMTLGIHLRSGIVCLMGCEAMLRDDRPFAGALAYAVFALATTMMTWPAVVIGAIAIVADSVGSPGRRAVLRHLRRLPLGVVVAGFGLLHGTALILSAPTNGGLIPYACLTAGVIVWTLWLDRRSGPIPADPDGTTPVTQRPTPTDE